MSSRELTEWAAFEQVYGPIGDERYDHLFAMLQSTLANVNREKKVKPYTFEQFMPGWGKSAEDAERPREMDPREMLRAAKRITRGMGG